MLLVATKIKQSRLSINNYDKQINKKSTYNQTQKRQTLSDS